MRSQNLINAILRSFRKLEQQLAVPSVTRTGGCGVPSLCDSNTKEGLLYGGQCRYISAPNCTDLQKYKAIRTPSIFVQQTPSQNPTSYA